MKKLYAQPIPVRVRQIRRTPIIDRIPAPIRVLGEYIAGYFVIGVFFLFAVALLAR